MKSIRFISLFLAVLAVFSLSACSSEKAPETQPSSTAARVPVATEPPAVTGEHGELVFEKTSNITLFENESCSFTLTKAEIDSLADYNWSVSLVNKLGNPQVFTIEDVYINDFAFDPIWAVKVESTKTDTSHVIWAAPEMEARGIKQIGRVDFRLKIYPADSPSAPSADEKITIYPSGRSTYIPQNRSPQTTDISIMDDASFTVSATSMDTESRWGYAVDLYLANKTDSPVTFSAESVRVNNLVCSTGWGYALDAGKQGCSQMIWLNEILENSGIEDVSSVSFDLVAKDASGREVLRKACNLIR